MAAPSAPAVADEIVGCSNGYITRSFDGLGQNSQHYEPFLNVKVYTNVYRYSATTTAQIKPSYDVHLIEHDGIAPPGEVFNLTLPRLQGYPSSRKVFLFHVKSANNGEIVRWTPFDANCQINALGAGASYSYTTDVPSRLFMCVGFYGGTDTTWNQYYLYPLGGLPSVINSVSSANALLTATTVAGAVTLTDNVQVTAGSGVSVSGSPNFAVSAFTGSGIAFGGLTVAAITALYFGITSPNATENSVAQWIAPRAGTVSQLYVRLSANLAVATNTLAFTVRKNAADTALTCTVATGSSTANDTTHSFTVAAGDLITAKSLQSATGEAVTLSCNMVFRPSSTA